MVAQQLRSRSINRPGANAIDTLKAVRGRIVAELEKRFPEDLAWKVTYDPTVFVKDTIHEVQKTLVEAFILVVIVVFLFLGSVRATLIPTLAVPVSLIGTFIALLAVGYSANSVSLLAIVLAIGIVVDDAIVVVENVERVMEEHPRAFARQRLLKRAMAEITAPIIAITLVLLSVFIPVAFIPGISGELFRQFAVTVAVSMVLSAINALTLSPALCGVLLRPHHGPRRGIMGWVMRSIDNVRDRYGAIVARLVRISIIGLVLVAISGVGVVGLAKITPTGFLPEDDQGAFFVVVQTPGGASLERTTKLIGKAEAILREDKAVEDVTSVIGLNFIDNYSQPNAGFLGRHSQAIRRAKRSCTRRSASYCSRWYKVSPTPRRNGHSASATANPRSWNRRRLYVCITGPSRWRPKSARPGSARARRRRQSEPTVKPHILDLLRNESIYLSRHQSRQGSNFGCSFEFCIPGAASIAWRILRQ